MLDTAAREHWTRHGWVWLRDFFDPDERAALARWTDEIASWPETPGRWMRYYERRRGVADERILARVENFMPYHPGLADIFSDARLLDLLAECAGEPVIL